MTGQGHLHAVTGELEILGKVLWRMSFWGLPALLGEGTYSQMAVGHCEHQGALDESLLLPLSLWQTESPAWYGWSDCWGAPQSHEHFVSWILRGAGAH